MSTYFSNLFSCWLHENKHNVLNKIVQLFMLYYFRYAVKIEKKQESVSKLSFVPAFDAGSHYIKRGDKGILTHFLFD